MFVIDADKTIHITRGDVATFSIGASVGDAAYTFRTGDIVRFKVFAKNDCTNVVLQKDFEVTEDGTSVEINLAKEDTTIGEIISKPVDYWYEVELNPDTRPQTIVAYDENGAKVFKVYPEGGN